MAPADWLAHFAGWRATGPSWQGWRPSGVADAAAIWLGLEGLRAAVPCLHAYHRPRLEYRAAVGCPGWDAAAKTWTAPVWPDPLTAEVARSLLRTPAAGGVRAVFARRPTPDGYTLYFGAGRLTTEYPGGTADG